MVASKKIHCAYCNKKCSGKVLRYQDQYYHKQCFELEQSEGAKRQELFYAHDKDNGGGGNSNHNNEDDDDELAAAAAARSPSATLRDGHQQHDDRVSSTQFMQQRMNNDTSAYSARQDFQPQAVGRQFVAGTSQPNLARANESLSNGDSMHENQQDRLRSRTIDARSGARQTVPTGAGRSATLPHSLSSPANGFAASNAGADQNSSSLGSPPTVCAGCANQIKDGRALIALDRHWHVWCFKCAQCGAALHGEYVAKDGKAYCERDYQRLFGVVCVYCKRYITGKVLQAGEAYHFHPSCARCSKCGDPFVPGEEMYLQAEVTWHPRCGPGPESAAPLDELTLDASSRSQLRASRGQSPSLSSRSHSRSASPFSFMSRQYAGRSSPGYADSEAVGDLSRIYTISYLNADPTQGYLRRPLEPNPTKSPQFSRPIGASHREGSRSSSRSQGGRHRERSVPRGMYSVLSSMRSGSSNRARSPSMLNEEAIHLAQYPSGQKPSPDAVPKIERDDFPAPPFPYPETRTRTGSRSASESKRRAQSGLGEAAQQQQKQNSKQQQRASRPRSREIVIEDDDDDSTSGDGDPQLRKEEEELSKIANGIGKIFLQTLKEREKLRAWKRANLDPRNASRTPSATRELHSRLRYDNPTNASPSRDLDRPRPWDEDELGPEHSPTRTRSSLGRPSQMSSSTYGYKVVQSNRSTPRPGYGLTGGPYGDPPPTAASASQLLQQSELSFNQQQRITQNRSADLLNQRASTLQSEQTRAASRYGVGGATSGATSASSFYSSHLRRSMPNVSHLQHLHQEGPPKLYPYHLLATSNYRLPPDVDRCHLERHLSNEEFQYIFHCDRLDFYRLPEWKRNELKRRAKLF